VYPGFLQLAGFMAMNLGNHLVSHWGMFRHLVEGDGEEAESTMKFYEEYRSVCDMTAEFYLQTIDVVFQRHLLPKGEMMHRGRRVDPAAITDIALLAIEGERDDISGLGQTKAALTIATALPDSMKRYHMAESVGHYGIFNGSKWRTRIAPVVEQWIAAHDAMPQPANKLAA
jgi:poly(3-hydroxybutyrate) depolymerase